MGRRGIITTLFAAASAVVFFFTSQSASAQFYYGSQMKFGKNRVQYDDFIWSYYKFDRYNIYFYTGGKNTAVYTAQYARKTLDEFQKAFDFYMEEKVYFLVYNKLEHFRQSNIGLASGEDYNIGGVTRISGSKVFIYNEGDHQKLEQQIREGIARIVLNKMMYGVNWKEMLKNSTLLNLPEWYVNGLVSYVASPWSVNIDNRLRDGMLAGQFEKFNRLTGDDATYAGHSLWNYIAEVYGKNVIPNILYMARISRNIESGFLFVLGVSLKTLTLESQDYYKRKYEEEQKSRSEPAGKPLPVKFKKNRVYNQLALHPDGSKAAYVTNQMGQFKVFMVDTDTGKKKRLMKEHPKLDRINDESYPLLGWNPNGDYLAIFYEEKGQVQLDFYLPDEKRRISKPIFRIERILDFAFSPDGKQMVFSAFRQGKTDLFLYNISSNSQEQITDDIYDDLYPRFVNGGKNILFSSNRSNDTLEIGKDRAGLLPPTLDLFAYNTQTESKVLRRITNTPEVNEIQPMAYNKELYTYLGDQNGIVNRYIARPDSAISRIDTVIHYRYFTKSEPITNYHRNIIEHEVQPEAEKFAEIVYYNGRYRLYSGDLDQDPKPLDFELEDTGFRENKNTQEQVAEQEKTKEEEKQLTYVTVDVFGEDEPVTPDSSTIDTDNYVFDGEPAEEVKPQKQNNRFIKLKAEAREQIAASDSTEPEEFRLPQNRNYNVNFIATDIVTQFDFDFANDIYQRFNGGPYFNPGMGSFIKLGIIDLFEDYVLEGGFRYSFNNNNTEYFISLENREPRLDRKYILSRQSITYVGDRSIQKNYTHQVAGIYKWPFSEVSAIQATALLRNDRLVTLSTDRSTLETPDEFANWAGGKFEYIFDNTISKGLNLYNGTRAKLFAEYMQEFNASQGDIMILGGDVRHYQKIHRNLIWANRMAASTSFGGRKLVYYMGAVDNWIVLSDRERFDSETKIATDQNYYFQTIATNMRGFIQNARNGNSFAVINSEIRWPIFKYFINKPIKSDLVSNFQVIGFGDLGTAWTGSNPYSDDNAFNTQETVTGPLTIRLQNQKDPIIGSYGLGVRTKLWGYFLRFDYAWGVEDGEVLTPITHFSLGLDF